MFDVSVTSVGDWRLPDRRAQVEGIWAVLGAGSALLGRLGCVSRASGLVPLLVPARGGRVGQAYR